jgi:hypothetical protein
MSTEDYSPSQDEIPSLVHIPFQGDDILSLRDERSGKEYVLPKHTAVNIFGISWQSQHRKLTTNPDFARGIITMMIPSGHGEQETLLLERKYFHTWLMGIDSRRIKDPAIRARLQAYKEEAADVLETYWTQGIVVGVRGHASEVARFDLMQAMLDELRRGAEERAKLAAEQERQRVEQENQHLRQTMLEEKIQSIEERNPPGGRYTVHTWLRREGKPYLPPSLLDNVKQECRRLQEPKRFRPEGSDYPLLYYTPDILEKAYALATRQLSFIHEAGVVYRTKRRHER